ncbi:ABC-2 family transporter protein [Bacteroidales bacterium 6E]|nr:ABC-2 family transporter protein [Bacteroidales bacterium 6E]
MISFHNIQSIAKYERKTLFRSWFFRIFGVLSILVLFGMNFGMVSEGGGSQWIFRAIPSAIPYFNLLILNVAQAIIAVFLASDFLKRDKKLDTTEVIYMRSMTNGEYVIGKTLGNMQVFMVLNFAILGIALIFNLIAENTGVPLLSYLTYLLLISIPTLVYIMGLSFLLMSLIRNQAVTFVVILGYIGITLFLVKDNYYYLFDYMSFNIPMLKSEIVGFGNIDTIIAHRGIYFFLGSGFVFLTIFLLKRLPQSESLTWFSLLFGVIFISAGGYLAYRHVDRFVSQEHQRTEAIELNNRYAAFPIADVKSHHIQLIHNKTQIEVVSKMELVNNGRSAIDTLVMHLNPGLVLSGLKVNNQESSYTRNKQLLVIPLKSKMEPASTNNVEITYSGNIDETFCYLDIDNEMRKEKFGEFVINVDKRHAFITQEYALLTPEANWYPETGVSYSSTNFGWSHTYFTEFTLEVATDTALQAVSQGTFEKTAPGKYAYKNDQPLTQISLAIGHYDYKKITAGNIDFGVWHIKGHDFFKDSFSELKDTIPSLIEERLRDFQRTYSLSYPFKRFNIVEVPAQFKPYQRTWSSVQETMQPEQVLIQEKGYLLRDFDFKNQAKNIKRWSERNGESLTDKDLQIRMINNVAGNFTREGGRPNFSMQAGGAMQVTETSNPHFIFPQYYYFRNHLRSDRWPVANQVLEAYLKNQSSDMGNNWMRNMTGMSEDEMASLALQDRSLEQLLNDREQRKLADNLIKLKGDVLFTAIQANAGESEFAAMLRNLLRENQFGIIRFTEFDSILYNNYNISLTPMMNDWFKEVNLPGYLFSSITAVNTKAGDQISTMVSFSASNTSNIDGVVKLSFRMGGPGGGGRGRMMMGPGADNSMNKILSLKAGETKRVSYLFDSEPRGLTINTLASKNIPQSIMQFFGRIEEDQKAVPVEGEFPSDVPVSTLQPNEIVVDNEDPGFEHSVANTTSLLHKWIITEEETGSKYKGMNSWRPPLDWTLTTNSDFYGLYIRSAHFIKSGTGDQTATWNLPVEEAGYYDVYTYVAQSATRGGGFGPGRRGGDNQKGEYLYVIHHDDGETEQSLQVNNAENGWNLLGSFYLGPGSKIVLSNKSELRTVVADAIKLVKL